VGQCKWNARRQWCQLADGSVGTVIAKFPSGEFAQLLFVFAGKVHKEFNEHLVGWGQTHHVSQAVVNTPVASNNKNMRSLMAA